MNCLQCGHCSRVIKYSEAVRFNSGLRCPACEGAELKEIEPGELLDLWRMDNRGHERRYEVMREANRISLLLKKNGKADITEGSVCDKCMIVMLEGAIEQVETRLNKEHLS